VLEVGAEVAVTVKFFSVPVEIRLCGLTLKTPCTVNTSPIPIRSAAAPPNICVDEPVNVPEAEDGSGQVSVRLVAMRLDETPLFYGEYDFASEKMTLTRTYEFAAAHRLHSPLISPEENVRLYGKCNNLMGHGHNYLLEVTVSGPVDSTNGMLIDLGTLDTVVEREIVDRYDHKNLNEDIPEFAGRITSTEVVIQQIFDRLTETLPITLERVRLHETARNVFEVVK
jgi:6-pyruvoyltetrahydropterin/6-carboxytetrahydropterin synthase